MSALVLHIRLHDGRYHGEGDWPPSPGRLFQALVAGAGLAGPLGSHEREALRWLEEQPAPIIAAPGAWQPSRGVRFYMPNNDSDRIEGDPLKMAKIRTATKVFRPYFFDAEVPFVYAWPLAAAQGDDAFARVICSLAERLYQLGRGVDMAWGWGEVLDDNRLDEFLATYPGRVFRPSAGKSATTLPSPCPGSLESIERRYRAYGERFRYVKDGKAVKVVFRQPPRPRFRLAAYQSPPSRALYELRDPTADVAFAPWPLVRASALVVRLRDSAVDRLKRALPQRSAEIDRVLVGRKPDGTNDGPPENRVRIIPLPSIGHVHADREIRRVLVEVPPSCPLRAKDVHWAFSGLDLVDVETGEVEAVLTRTEDEGFLRHYGLADAMSGAAQRGHRVWRTVTPAALPEGARRRRIGPARKRAAGKAGSERAKEEAHAAFAGCQALRHAGVRAGVEAVRVQREPFEGNGTRVEPFARGTRFPKERLWHVEIHFAEPVTGPLVIGDGRFLGLGVMAPLPTVAGIYTFVVESGLENTPDPIALARALRRAVMARVQAVFGETVALPAFFTGHESNGAPARSENNPHLFFLFVPGLSRLMVIAPHLVERRALSEAEQQHLQILDKALFGFCELRAGAMGCLRLRAISIDPDTDPLFAVSRVWESVTPYVVTRHLKQGSAAEALSADLCAECSRRGFPKPVVTPGELRGISGTGLVGVARLTFPVPVQGPLILGRHRYLGGGLFAGRPRELCVGTVRLTVSGLGQFVP
ncbi:type I-G CRISPR-associated protein Csb2 [Nitrospira sp. Kam-Ns4a]